jgi:RNA polymerase sigma-70 factor (ECF subfamily)
MTHDRAAPARFPTTRLSIVLAAAAETGSQSNDALDALCRAYWPPLYAFIRRNGHDEDAARDLTQAFIARLIEKGTLRQFERGRGRFRTFLLACLKHFLSNQRDLERARKRGGGRAFISIDDTGAFERWSRLEPADRTTPETIFERQWALEVLQQAMSRLEEDCAREGGASRFRCLKPYLTREGDAPAYRDAAGELGITEGAVKVAVHRLRERFHHCLRDQVSLTVAHASDIGDEIRYLIAALRQQG